MPNREQDIPIRPRYGIPEAAPPEDSNILSKETEMQESKMSKNSKMSGNEKHMVSSYSEIPFLAQYPGAVPEQALRAPSKALEPNESLEEEDDSDNSNHSSQQKHSRRPESLQCDSTFPYALEGASTADGEMRHFAAENVDGSPLKKGEFIGLASQNSTPSSSAKCMTNQHILHHQHQHPHIDVSLLNEVEIEAQYLASSVDTLVDNLCNLLHSISSISADNVEVHNNAVNKLTDSMDANIKCMYTIMAKTEEISKTMKPTEEVAEHIREIKRLVEMFENSL